jgi:hypothetical protein
MASELQQLEGSLSVYNPNSIALAPDEITRTSQHQLDAQYTDFLCSLDLASWPYLQCLVALTGESNMDVLRQVLSAMHYWRGNVLNKEIKAAIIECNKVSIYTHT